MQDNLTITNETLGLRAEVEALSLGNRKVYEVRVLHTNTGDYAPKVRYRQSEPEAVALAQELVRASTQELVLA